jgi:hypothetical protein
MNAYRPGDPPLRPERHVPNSIATVRRKLVVIRHNFIQMPMLRRTNRGPEEPQ